VALGTLPLDVIFTATVTGAIPAVSYYWDFTGDGAYVRRSTGPVTSNRYTVAGVYTAKVTAVSESGLAGSASTVITVSEPPDLRTWIVQPQNGQHVWGSALTLHANTAPGSQTRSLKFQYRLEGAVGWTDLTGELLPPPYSFSASWDVTGLLNGSNYCLRTLATDTAGRSVVSTQVMVTVDSSAGNRPGDVIEQNRNGQHERTQTMSVDESAEMIVSDGTTVDIGLGTTLSNATVRITLVGANTYPSSGATVGKLNINQNRRVEIEGNPSLNKPITLIIPYTDDNNDGIVDGTSVLVSTLMIYWYDTTTSLWKLCLSSEVNLQEKYVKATVYNLAEFGVFGSLRYRPIFGDYDGDRKADPVVYSESSGAWHVLLSDNSYAHASMTFGGPGFKTAPGDFDGDGRADPSVYQEMHGAWYSLLSGSGYITPASSSIGGPRYRFVSGDFDGDGKADPAVYHRSSGVWMVQLSGSGYAAVSMTFGSYRYVPLAVDFDGDGKVDPALYQDTTGMWYVLLSNSGYAPVGLAFGGPGYTAVPYDYDGDGKADPALYQEVTGRWTVLMSGSAYGQVTALFGGLGFSAVPGDYDGVGMAAPAVYQGATGQWIMLLPIRGYTQLSFQVNGVGLNPVGVEGNE